MNHNGLLWTSGESIQFFTMKKNLIFIFHLISTIFFVESSLAANDSPDEKMKYYLKEAMSAYESKDYKFACQTATHALIFAKQVDGGKSYKVVKDFSEMACNLWQDEIVKIRNNNPYQSLCPSYKQIKQTCAGVYDYKACMDIRWGVTHPSFEYNCD